MDSFIHSQEPNSSCCTTRRRSRNWVNSSPSARKVTNDHGCWTVLLKTNQQKQESSWTRLPAPPSLDITTALLWKQPVFAFCIYNDTCGCPNHGWNEHFHNDNNNKNIHITQFFPRNWKKSFYKPEWMNRSSDLSGCRRSEMILFSIRCVLSNVIDTEPIQTI